MVFGFSLFVFKTKEFTAKQKQNLSEKICGHKEVGYSAERKSGGRRMYGQEASLSSNPCYASGNKEITIHTDVDITPSLHLYNFESSDSIPVELCNVTTRTVTVPPHL